MTGPDVDAHSSAVAAEAPEHLDVDRPGALSIVVQGGLFASNAAETANNVRHWQSLFPSAQIILSLSGADILATDSRTGDLGLAPPVAHDTVLRAAWRAIGAACDQVVLVEDALPLPPIKADTTRPNHANLQIAAARAGLERAAGHYALRVRNDLIFTNRAFIDQYRRDYRLPRGDTAVLGQRVMISWLYTLNPYAAERLPFHFSDWFHFGLLEDVRSLWQIDGIPYRDAVHYLADDLPGDSAYEERLFNMRLAVEQHVTWEGLGRRIPGLDLARFNDPDGRERSLDVLADNYVLCDLRATGMVFPKYQNELFNDRKLTACITPEMWRQLARLRFVDPKLIMLGDTEAPSDSDRAELRAGFPRRYMGSALGGAEPRLRRGVLASDDDRGTLFISRAIRLPPGDFRVTLDVAGGEGSGHFDLKVLPEREEEPLAKASIAVEGGEAKGAEVTFTVGQPHGPRVRVACDLAGVRSLAVRGFSIDQVHPRDEDRPLPRIVSLGGAGSMGTRHVGRLALRPGQYVAAANVARPADGRRLQLQITGADGGLIGESGPAHRPDDRLTAVFDVLSLADRTIEVVLSSDEAISPADIVIAARGSEGGQAAFPRFYGVLDLRAGRARYEGDEIVGSGAKGLLCYGPYISLPAGGYRAEVSISRLSGSGRMLVSVTCSDGTRELARRVIPLRGGCVGSVSIPFEVAERGAHRVEVVCRTSGVREVAVTGLIFRRRDAIQPVEAVAPRRSGWTRRLGMLKPQAVT